MIRSEPRRLALSIGAATLAPVVALAWLGVRVLQQDRDIERQRRRERLEVAAGRLALDLERALQQAEDRLARGDGIRLRATGLEATSGRPVLYQPDLPAEPPAQALPLVPAERLEFQARDLAGAAAAYRNLARDHRAPIGAAALVGLARVLRQMGDSHGALRAYAELERFEFTPVGGQPARLVALQGRCRVLEESSDAAGLRTAADALAALLHAGTPIDRATFAVYREMLDRWGAAATPSDALARTDAAIRIWQSWRAADLPPRGRHLVRLDHGAALAVWAGEPASPTLWIATAADLEAQLAPITKDLSLQAAIVDTEGERIAGHALAGAPGSLSLTPAETRLPFVLSVAPAADGFGIADASRRRLVIAGLAAVLVTIVAAACGLYRATARELALARQQSDFVSAVSHEFRTPLTSMRHLTDLLVSRGVTSEERRSHYYGLLAHETERLYRMVETLLSFGRIEAGAYAFHLEPVSPSAVVAGVVEEFRAEALARGREITSEIDDTLPSILADRETLARALWNLIENAAKYSAAGTPIRVFAERRGDFVLLGVGDRGAGVAPDERDRIFQKFVRGTDAKRAGVRGVGIGLALVKRIAEAHGGSVRVESEPGRGSTFTIVVPAEVRLKADDAHFHARGEPFDSSLILSLSKDERLAQDRLVEPRARPSTGSGRAL